MIETPEEKVRRAERLVKQSKRCQVFQQKSEEAAKTAEAAALYLEVAMQAPSREHYEQAKACLARSLSLCRLLLKGQRKKEKQLGAEHLDAECVAG